MGAGDLLGKDARAAGGVQLCALVRQILVVGRYPGVTDHRLVFHGAPFVANIVANNKLFATDFCNMMTPGKKGDAVTFRRRQHEISKVDRTVFSDVGVASENGK
ncbi:hypothetical protein [Pseudomonas rhodesiae]|uniref:hypothetical protein n=1 Tax=Pseudomonas rhodesiae TaxID=76760 RepID=UPI0024DF88EB|nr:hypothetical protein [Pseudomonas rhodesiae]